MKLRSDLILPTIPSSETEAPAWNYSSPLSFYTSYYREVLMSGNDLAAFISFQTRKDFNKNSIVTGSRTAIRKNIIKPPVEYTVDSFLGVRSIPLYDAKACCYFIKKYASKNENLIIELMQLSFNAYIQALYTQRINNIENALSQN